MPFFGKSKKKAPAAPQADSPQAVLQNIHDMEDMLNKKSAFLEGKIEQQISLAKRHGTANKKAAIAALVKKKRFEKQLQQVDGTLSTLEFQREALENAHTNTTVLKVMAGAASALKKAHQNMDVDQVHDLMDAVSEEQEVANEITEALSNPAGFGRDVYDEDELFAELEELEQEELDNRLLEATPVVKHRLPDVPVAASSSRSRTFTRPQAVAERDEDDMRDLAQWAK